MEKSIDAMSSPRYKLAYLLYHPIQYQSPLLRRITQDPDIDLHVFFESTIAAQPTRDPGFGVSVQWDVDMLGGYSSEFLPALSKRDTFSYGRPFNYGLWKRLREGRFDALWIHGYARWFNDWAMIEAKLCGIKILLRDEATPISTHRGPVKRFIKQGYFGVLTRLVDGYLAIGSLNRKYYQGYGVRDERIFSVPYAVDNAFFRERAFQASRLREDLRAQHGLERGRPVILFASKMIPRKRPDELLDAYALLSADGRTEPHPYLLFIGDGELRVSLEARAQTMKWDSIRFLGFKNQTELPAYYDLCDLFVLPSVNEPWGLVVNEVMNAGRPVIVSDQVGAGPDLVKEGRNGFIYTSGHIRALADRLHTATSNPARMKEMGKASLQIIETWGFEQDLQGLKSALRAIVKKDIVSA